jgi:hypothetical protein
MSIDLNSWKLTLDIEDPSNKSRPLEISPPELLKFQHPHFVKTDASITFKAECGGKTTSGTKYPRSELRELNGDKLASWKMDQGIHEMIWTCAVTSLPKEKPQVVVGQIHDDEDDVIEIRHTKDYVEVIHDDKNYGKLITGYRLGDVYTASITVRKGVISVFSGKTSILISSAKNAKNCYFKMGCYTQSNLSKGDLPKAFGEVKLYALRVTHTK